MGNCIQRLENWLSGISEVKLSAQKKDCLRFSCHSLHDQLHPGGGLGFDLYNAESGLYDLHGHKQKNRLRLGLFAGRNHYFIHIFGILQVSYRIKKNSNILLEYIPKFRGLVWNFIFMLLWFIGNFVWSLIGISYMTNGECVNILSNILVPIAVP